MFFSAELLGSKTEGWVSTTNFNTANLIRPDLELVFLLCNRPGDRTVKNCHGLHTEAVQLWFLHKNCSAFTVVQPA